MLPTNLSLKLVRKSKPSLLYRGFLVLFVFSSRPPVGVLAMVVMGRFFPGVPGVFGEIGSDGFWDIYPKLFVFFDFDDVGPLIATSLEPKLVISSVTLPSDFAVLFTVFSDFVTFISDSSPPVAPPKLGDYIML